MIKVFELLTRNTSMTHDQAMTYWTGTHAPLVKKQTGGSTAVRRYLNNVGIPSPFGGTGADGLSYDGAVEAILDVTIEQFRQMIDSGDNIVVADEPNFLSCKPAVLIVDPIGLKPFAPPFQTKVLMFWKRNIALTQSAAEALSLRHCRSALAFWGAAVAGLILNRCRPVRWTDWGEEMPAHDGVIEYYLDIAPANLADQWGQYTAQLGESLAAFASDIRWLCVHEVVQVGDGPGPG